MAATLGTFDLWIQRQERKREERESSRKQLLARLIEWLDNHSIEFGLDEAIIFGSLIEPNSFGDRSDIDIALPGSHAASDLRLASAIERALGREVDILRLSECRFADSIQRSGLAWIPS